MTADDVIATLEDYYTRIGLPGLINHPIWIRYYGGLMCRNLAEFYKPEGVEY